MYLFKCLTEDKEYVYVYATGGLEALQLANQSNDAVEYKTVEFIFEPIVITRGSF